MIDIADPDENDMRAMAFKLLDVPHDDGTEDE